MRTPFFPLFLAAFLLSTAVFASEFPTLKKGLNDFTGTVSSKDAASINALCSQIEKNTSVQIAILVVNSTAPYDIADYSVRTAEQNGIGKKKLDNGILMVIAKSDRTWRIDVGYGLEGVLPDGKVGEIGRNYLVPYLKSGEYGKAIYSTISRIGAELGATEAQQSQNSQGDLLPVFLVFAFVLAVFIAAIFLPASPGGGISGGGIIGGRIGGGFRRSGGGFGGGRFGGGGAGGKF